MDFQSPTPSQRTSNCENFRSPQQKKEVLRNHILSAQALENNLNIKTAIEKLGEMIKDVDQINQEGTIEDKIENQGEIVLDSEIMNISSHVLKKCTFSLSKNLNSYDYIDFAGKIISYVQRIPDTLMEETDWSLLAKEVIQNFNKVPNYTMIMGTLKPVPKKEIIRKQRAPREAQAAVKRPENVVAAKQSEDKVAATVSNIRKYLKRKKEAMYFFKLVLHPTNFGKTIENMLHVSFLVKDAKVKIFQDDDGILMIQYKSDPKESDKSKRPNIQNVISLNMDQWRKLVEAYKIQEAIDFDQI